MNNTKTILAISGSTRSSSTNYNYINALAAIIGPGYTITHNQDLITSLPHFTPDLDTETPPQAVTHFRQQLRYAHGILICTPEYAMGVPGTLKNAIDWTVSSCEFSHKPVALITASTLGEKAHQSLIETLNIIEAHLIPATTLLIPNVKTKINPHNQITHNETHTAIINLIQAFKAIL